MHVVSCVLTHHWSCVKGVVSAIEMGTYSVLFRLQLVNYEGLLHAV